MTRDEEAMSPRERPIRLYAHDVRGVLSGRQTQVRRIVKPQPSPELLQEYANIRAMRGSTRTDAQMLTDCLPCPFGVPGDRLWVRETYIDLGACFLYRADANAEQDRALVAPRQKWRPSIHMPREASRITLEITDVRVERLREISDADALAEGLRSDGSLGSQCSVELPGHRTHHNTPIECFRALWESINGPGSWEQNPWVWAITFRRVT